MTNEPTVLRGQSALLSGEHVYWTAMIRRDAHRAAVERFLLSPAAQRMARNMNRAMREVGVAASVAVERMAASMAKFGEAVRNG